ncbi:MAG TPA: hypothetical protein VFE55_05575 [Acidimicrobiia bacterium]|nr:hypothetical protein [Acidimicrobiia bacterium]
MAVVLLAAAVATQNAHPPRAGALTAAPIAKVQVGAVTRTATATATPTLPAASTAGTLLVATLATQKNTVFTAPSGWTQAVNKAQTNAEAAIWFYPNNPGGIASASFTSTGATSISGQLSEWSGVATASPLDKSGSASATLATSVTPATSQATTVAGELAVTAVAQYIVLAGTATYTPGSGWTNLGNTGATSSSYQYTADYRTGVPAGVVSETVTSSASGALSAAVATFKPVTCTGGTLGLTPPSTVAFPAVTLNGTDQTATASAGLTPSDMSGSAAGWNVQATSTTFTNGGGRTLPTSATTVTGAAATAVSGNCDLPTNSIAYPVTLPAGATAPTPVKVYNAAAGTGGGPLTLTLSVKLAVPASAYMGSFSSTWTFTIASGP